MRVPTVEVKVMGDKGDVEEVKKIAQSVADSLCTIGWEGKVHEVSLLGQLLMQCGANFEVGRRK